MHTKPNDKDKNGAEMTGTTSSRIYFWVMVALGFAACGVSAYSLFGGNPVYQWLILASLTVITGAFTIKLPGVNSKISLADTLICINIVLFGPAAGALTAAMDGIIGSARAKTASRRLEFALFNGSSMSVSALLGGLAFTSLIGRPMLYHNTIAPAGSLLPALALLALVYYFANSTFVAIIVALEQGQSIFAVWREKFLFAIVNYVAAASVAGLLAQTEGSITLLMILTILTALAAIYISSKSFAETAGDALEQEETTGRWLNSVGMLADAIGTKEKWTRDDSQRLGVHVRALGRAMGCSSEVMQSLETAALLHDVGKIAVPESILSKPGKLTPEEFERMKVHPAVAADILASANFPQRITDCVRHLREHWDGTGYPNKLRGSEIPLEPRILAVADGYTVLTSDRPYRPKYSREDAVKILRSDAGKVFDPEVVETFIRILPDIKGDPGHKAPEYATSMSESANAEAIGSSAR
jgi:HD-GYP domain-containing protein (c-di-GMP phosphodiesterase class II)